MKTLVYQGIGKIEVKDMPQPKPGKDELLLKPQYVGLCFSDLHAYYNGFPLYTPGIVLGHEVSGVVAEVGPGVEGWKVGTRIALDPRTYCGECLMCQAGFYTQCQKIAGWIGINSRRPSGELYHGALTEYCAVPAYTCFKVPDTVSDVAATNVEAMCCGTRAIRLSGIAVGDNVVILGAEDYAMSTLQWAKIAGAKQVVMADPIKARQDTAESLGADVVIDPTATDLVRKVRELMPFGADLVFVAMEDYIKPSLKYLSQAIDIARVQGTVGIIRAYGEEGFHGLTPIITWTKEITIKHFGIFFGEEPWRGGKERGDFKFTIDAMAEKRIDAESHVTRVIPFDEVNTNEDVDAIYRSLPEEEKILFSIWAK